MRSGHPGLPLGRSGEGRGASRRLFCQPYRGRPAEKAGPVGRSAVY